MIKANAVLFIIKAKAALLKIDTIIHKQHLKISISWKIDLKKLRKTYNSLGKLWLDPKC